MKRLLCLTLPLLLGLLACTDVGIDPSQPYELISQDCMDLVSGGTNQQVFVRTEAEYAELYQQRFARPLQEYWNDHYQEILQYFLDTRPGLSDSQYSQLVHDMFYSAMPFQGTENCAPPDIDFGKYSLLGINSDAGGCTPPMDQVSIQRDDRRRTVTVNMRIETHGDCDMGFFVNRWLLVPSIPVSYDIRFNLTRVHVD
jgi:hypothetical protein